MFEQPTLVSTLGVSDLGYFAHNGITKTYSSSTFCSLPCLPLAPFGNKIVASPPIHSCSKFPPTWSCPRCDSGSHAPYPETVLPFSPTNDEKLSSWSIPLLWIVWLANLEPNRCSLIPMRTMSFSWMLLHSTLPNLLNQDISLSFSPTCLVASLKCLLSSAIFWLTLLVASCCDGDHVIYASLTSIN